MKLDIFIADDHEIVRQGLKNILSDARDVQVTGEAGSGETALDVLQNGSDYDVIVLDISLPGISGMTVLKEIRDSGVTAPVLMLSIHPESQYAIRALKAGANGYLTKSSAPEELVNAIWCVAEGKKYVSSELAQRLASYASQDIEKQPHELLSNREFQVMKMMATGMNLTEIGEQLNLSPKTISTYRRRIMEKMDMENNAEVVQYALKNELILVT